jgi:hypothetical protein
LEQEIARCASPDPGCGFVRGRCNSNANSVRPRDDFDGGGVTIQPRSGLPLYLDVDAGDDFLVFEFRLRGRDHPLRDVVRALDRPPGRHRPRSAALGLVGARRSAAP